MLSDIVIELIHEGFEFEYKSKPSGHYARGRIIKWYDDNICLVELFHNGRKYKIDKRIVPIKYITQIKNSINYEF